MSVPVSEKLRFLFFFDFDFLPTQWGKIRVLDGIDDVGFVLFDFADC
jgi:hypothetical protein